MADDVDRGWLAGATGLLPGLGAGVVCGALALGQGPAVAAAVAGLGALPLAAGSVAVASLRGDDRGEGWIAPATAVALASPALAVLGALLKANTHHRALAGVTFAIVGAGVAVGALAVGGRVRLLAAGRPAVGGAAALAAAAAVAWLALRLGGAVLLDAALLPLALGGGWLVARWRSRAAGAAALAALVGMGTVGLVVGQGAETARQVQARGLLLASMLPSPAAGADLAPGGQDH